MKNYETPGIYREVADASVGGIAALRTDIAGFAGITQRGPVGIAVPVDSVRQFEAWFGAPIDSTYLAYSARAFFENGGRRMWVVRVASPANASASLTLSDSAGPAWRIAASSPGVWGNDLSIRVTEVRRAQVRARIDDVDQRLLHTERIADFERAAHIECIAGVVEHARVASVDAVNGTLMLTEPLSQIGVSAVIRVESLAYTIEVFEAGRLLAVHGDLSLVAEHPRYAPTLLKQPWRSERFTDHSQERVSESDLALDYFRVARNRSVRPPPAIVVHELRNLAQQSMLRPLRTAAGEPLGVRRQLDGGGDGLDALSISDFLGESVAPGSSSETISAFRRGIAALEPIDEVGLLAVPDIHIQPRAPHVQRLPEVCKPDPCLPTPVLPPTPTARAVGETPPRFTLQQIYTVQAAMVAQAERLRDRFALLDAPFDACTELTFAESELRAWRNRFESAFAALYAPWLEVVDPLRGRGSVVRAIPPSGHVAGQCAAIDQRLGVHIAPANVALNWVQDTTLDFDESRHGRLNSLGINVLRARAGRGIRVLGARTMSSDTDWRFVNVRRLLFMIEKAIDLSIQWAVFEPNNWHTRAKLALVIGSFIRELWRRGALVGANETEAFYVRCDESNNPPFIRDQGRLIIDIGIAPSVPFEFIVLRIGRDANGFAMTTGEPTVVAV